MYRIVWKNVTCEVIMDINFIKALLSGIVTHLSILIIQVMTQDIDLILSHGVNMSAQEFLMLGASTMVVLNMWYGTYCILSKE